MERKKLKDEVYYTVVCMGGEFEVHSTKDFNLPVDDSRWKDGNYFNSKKEAEDAIVKIKECLKRH